MYKIAIVEDEKSDNDKFKEFVLNLWPESQVDQWFDVMSAVGAIEHIEYDIIISDIDLGPGSDSCGAMKIIEALDPDSTPLLIVSGSSQPEIQRETYRQLKAWDYLQKPISKLMFHTILKRAIGFRQYQLKQLQGANSANLSIDPHLKLDYGFKDYVLWKGEKVSLTMTQIKILELLVTKANLPVAIPEFYKVIKTGTNIENVRVCVGKVRKAFLEVDPTFKSIKTITMGGYAWIV